MNPEWTRSAADDGQSFTENSSPDEPDDVTAPVTDFIKHHYRHFNAAAVVDAAEAWNRHLDGGRQDAA